MKEKQSDFSRTDKAQKNSIRAALIAAARNSLVRNIVISATIMIAALFVVFGVADAAKPIAPVSAVKSPIPQPVSVVLDCDETWGNPSCRTSAATTSGKRLYSYFYIDGRYRGSANKTYTNVCSLYWLRDGIHSARVYAVDAGWNSVGVGPSKVIHCDRFNPVVYTSVWYGRGWTVHLAPSAIDYGSGVASKTFSVDNVDRTWQSYASACTQLSLARGWHQTKVMATDAVGHSVTGGVRNFYCV